jgi:pimeloyl-ACP methyl ester carboxylesterase
MEGVVMFQKTCAACDCTLDERVIKVTIAGKTVEGYCDEWVQRLPEAHLATSRSSASVREDQRRIARTVALVLAAGLAIGFYLGAVNIDAATLLMTSTLGLGVSAVDRNKPPATRRSVQTPSGQISYTEQGKGPAALFVHGVLMNGHLWRHQLAELSDIRRCIAVDLLAHGDTEIAPDQGVSASANGTMLKEFLDALNIDQVDLVGNDSGGGIAQIFAATYPERVRSLTLTDSDTHDNWPPEAFKPFLAMAAAGGLRGTLDAMLADKSVYRSQEALGPAYEHPERVNDEVIETYLRPFVRTEQRTRDLERFLAAFDNSHTVAILPRLKALQAPTLIVWGTDDVYFDVKWSHWLAKTIPGTRRRVELKGARIFFPEERWAEFNKELRAHWQAAQGADGRHQ